MLCRVRSLEKTWVIPNGCSPIVAVLKEVGELEILGRREKRWGGMPRPRGSKNKRKEKKRAKHRYQPARKPAFALGDQVSAPLADGFGFYIFLRFRAACSPSQKSNRRATGLSQNEVRSHVDRVSRSPGAGEGM
jgi:hypothetical protein